MGSRSKSPRHKSKSSRSSHKSSRSSRSSRDSKRSSRKSSTKESSKSSSAKRIGDKLKRHGKDKAKKSSKRSKNHTSEESSQNVENGSIAEEGEMPSAQAVDNIIAEAEKQEFAERIAKLEATLPKIEAVSSPAQVQQMEVSSSGGAVSASLSETNRIRAQLGLRLLSESAGPSKETLEKQKKERERMEELHQKELEETRERLRLLKEKKEHQKRVSGMSIVDGLKGDAATATSSALDWVSSQRVSKADKKLARSRAQFFDAQDEEQDDDEEDSYVPDNLSGLRVLHDSTQFSTGQDVILTLKDERILSEKGDAENEVEDALENVDIVAQERVDRNLRRKIGRIDYDPYADQAELLPQYGILEPKRDGFRLKSSAEKADETVEQRVQSVRARLKAVVPTAEYNLNAEKALQTDYLTTEEMNARRIKKVKLKKKKKKRSTKSRTRRQPTLSDLPVELAEEREAELKARGVVDRLGLVPGARETAERGHDVRDVKRLEMKRDIAERSERFDRAFAKSHAESGRLFDGPGASGATSVKEERADTRLLDPSIALTEEEARERSKLLAVRMAERVSAATMIDGLSDEDDDMDVRRSVATARQLAVKKKKKKESLAARVNRSRDIKQEQKEQEKKVRVTFTEASDFVSGLQSGQVDLVDLETGEQAPIVEDLEHLRPIEPETKPERARGEGWTNPDEPEETESKSSKPKADDGTFLENEPLVKGGMFMALQVARRSGFTDKESQFEFSGRANDEKPNWNRAIETTDPAPDLRLEYLDEETGRPMTRKEAFRALSHRFHGKKPGSKKTAKRQKERAMQEMRRKGDTVDTPFHTLSKLQDATKTSGQAFVVLDGNQDVSELGKRPKKRRKR
eukprot:131777_1